MSDYLDYDFDSFEDFDFENFEDFEPYFEQNQDDVSLREEEEEYDNSEEENSTNSRKTSPTWKYFDEQTSQHPGKPVCCKCKSVFGSTTGISTLKRHLLSAHKIKISNIKNTTKNQSILNFKRIDPWPDKE